MRVNIAPFDISQSVSCPTLHGSGEHADIYHLILQQKEKMLVNDIFSYYENLLRIDEPVQEWLQARKIYHPDLGKHLKIGFADNSFGNTLDRSRTVSGEETRAILRRMGLMMPTGYQYFRQSVVFPFLDENSEIIGAYGRRIADRARNTLKLYLHWNQDKVTFFNLAALKKYKILILVKSPIEAITLWCAGITNVISLMGLYSFSERHLAALEENHIQKVIIGFDNTDYANYISGMVAETLQASSIECARLLLPRNHDINSYALSQEDHINALKELLANACPFQKTHSNLLSIQ